MKYIKFKNVLLFIFKYLSILLRFGNILYFLSFEIFELCKLFQELYNRHLTKDAQLCVIEIFCI